MHLLPDLCASFLHVHFVTFDFAHSLIFSVRKRQLWCVEEKRGQFRGAAWIPAGSWALSFLLLTRGLVLFHTAGHRRRPQLRLLAPR